MKIIVCGGRNYEDAETVNRVLDDLHKRSPITLLIEGGAKGADALAAKWAHTREVAWLQIPADWKQRGRSAGPERNAKMLKHEPKLVVAFPGGPGTANMIKQARAAGVEVLQP